jgi:hypothetical protein
MSKKQEVKNLVENPDFRAINACMQENQLVLLKQVKPVDRKELKKDK